MKFKFNKCAVLKVKTGKQASCEGIDIGDSIVIEEVDEEGCKCLKLQRDITFAKSMSKKGSK